MTATREALEGFLPEHRLATLDNPSRTRLFSLARTTLSVPGALTLAQELRCFHCNGVMPVLCGDRHYSRLSREHVLPRAGREAGTPYQALLLAHALCNEVRSDRPFGVEQWERAIAVWIAADRHWLEAGKGASPFLGWVEMARQRQKEAGQ